MKILSSQISGYVDKSSWIRKMFEAGIELKQKYGEDAVCDFSLGNPDLPPPESVGQGLKEIAEDANKPFAFAYMPNFGYPHLRAALAGEVSKEQSVKVAPEDLVLTCGAAGAINAFYRAVIDPGDEVICPAPFFVEYGFYIENHGGTLKPILSDPKDFSLDLDAIDRAISEKTRVVLINSPNNPSGQVYSLEELTALAEILNKHNQGRERPIFLLADEPYRFLTFDGAEVPSILPLYPYSVVVSSFSKNLSLAGARLGYALVNPDMPGKEQLVGGMIMTNRILGFVNPPAVGQQLLAKILGSQVDVSVYASRRDAMARVLDGAGVSYVMPKGAFYFFPEAPGGNGVKFCSLLLDEKILAVPGTGFGYPGSFRLAFCISEEVINRSADGFARAVKLARG